MNKVFKIRKVSQDEQIYIYSAEIDARHPVFRGHFPEMPVMPGVCTMNMIKECIADALSRHVRYDYVKECKFLSAITPSKHKILEVMISLKQSDDQMSVVAEVISGEVKMMKLKATLL